VAVFIVQIRTKCVTYKTLSIDGLNIAYREAGDLVNPKLVLLHGFPSSSHQYRNLIPSLADRFHVISPDYPGFGNSDSPDPAKFAYTFDNLAEVTRRFLEQKGFDRFGMYVQDYGGPVGFRIVTQKPEALEWLIIQNTNAYEVGFTDAWAGCATPYGRAAHLRMKRELRVYLSWKRLRRSTFMVRRSPS
jgi:pimeloyl-ACP methyl ester carboxylesterase